MLLTQLIVFLILLLIALVYMRLALQFGIVDKPNHRSSHSRLTVRGGGILFPCALIFWWMSFDFVHTWLLIGMIWIAAISLLDDMYTLSGKLRFLVQFLALSMAFYDLGVFDKLNIYSLPILYFVCLGIINAINFMDGINGITGLYGLIFFGTILAVQVYMPIFEVGMVRYIILALLIFLIFNFRNKAMMFAGDIGSISLAYLMIFFIVQWYLAAQTWTIILLLAVYGIDVAVTMFERWRRGEKLSEPHRSHLYQLLVNQFKFPHVNVAIAYAMVQAVLNFCLFIIPKSFPEPWLAGTTLVVLTLIYLGIKLPLRKKLQLG